MSKIKLLCVTEGLCYPAQSGGAQAVFNAYKLLQYEVELHIFVIGNTYSKKQIKEYEEQLVEAKHHYFDISQRNSYEIIRAVMLKLYKKIMHISGNDKIVAEREGMLNLNLERYGGALEAINRYIHDNKINIVQFEFGRPMWWAQAIVEPCKKVFVQHEIQYVVGATRIPEKASYALKMRNGILRNQEIMLINGYDAVITLSQEDADRLVSDGIRVPVYPSFAKVQMREAEPIDYNEVENVDLVFVGPEGHIPNKKGMSWFVSKVWEKILIKHPNTQLYVVGKWSNKTRIDWSNQIPNIHFTGFVDDLCVAMQKRLLIVPVQEGSGIRMKILEAANVGVPFIACKVGAEGLAFEHGKNAYITDNADEFAEYVNELLSNHNRLNEFAQAAYHHVKDSFTDVRFINSRMKCFNNLVKCY